MSNIQTGAERMPHDLSHLGFLDGQIGRLITISTTSAIAGDSFEMDAVGALRLSPLICDRSSRLSARNSLSRLIFWAWYFGRLRHLGHRLSRMVNQTGAQLRWSSILTTTCLAPFSKVSTTKRSIFWILGYSVTAILAG